MYLKNLLITVNLSGDKVVWVVIAGVVVVVGVVGTYDVVGTIVDDGNGDGD